MGPQAAGERAYVYAKACGIIGKSFVGRRTGALGHVSRLSELDRLIFSGGAQELPERELLPDLERRILGRSVDAAVSIVGCFKHPPELLVLLVQSYEYADLKTALAMLSEAEGSAPPPKPVFADIGRFATVNFGAWPDEEAMLKGTEYKFILKKNDADAEQAEGEAAAETALDVHYYRRLWDALLKLKKTDRAAAEKIIREEIALRNAAWALRLRTYYGMNAEEVRRRLVFIPGREELTRGAVEALELPLDSHAEWERWRFASFLNKEGLGEGPWRVDPRYFQNTAAEYLYRMALRQFRRRPLSLDTVFCFIKLKQFEEDLLTSAAEGLALGMPGRDVFDLLEVNV